VKKAEWKLSEHEDKLFEIRNERKKKK
jgi:hypothetical protein